MRRSFNTIWTKLAGFDGRDDGNGFGSVWPSPQCGILTWCVWLGRAGAGCWTPCVRCCLGARPFPRTDPAPYRDVMSLLQEPSTLHLRYGGRQGQSPPNGGFCKGGRLDKPAEKAALQMLPACCGSYLNDGRLGSAIMRLIDRNDENAACVHRALENRGRSRRGATFGALVPA